MPEQKKLNRPRQWSKLRFNSKRHKKPKFKKWLIECEKIIAERLKTPTEMLFDLVMYGSVIPLKVDIDSEITILRGDIYGQGPGWKALPEIKRMLGG